MTFLFYDTIKILKTISWICEICACEEYVMSEWLKLSFKVYIYIYIYIDTCKVAWDMKHEYGIKEKIMYLIYALWCEE